jgi:hypothetical protein
MIELHIDNIMRGLLKLDFFDEDIQRRFLDDLMKWSKLHHNKVEFTEFNQLTDKLYDHIFHFRSTDQIKGELKEIENEKLIESLKERVSNLDAANKALAQEVMKYKTPEQKKDFKGVG